MLWRQGNSEVKSGMNLSETQSEPLSSQNSGGQDLIWDVLVIGGGPGGSSAAAFLARKGKRVLVLEKERFPRFHVGESLLPYNMQLFEELGLTDKLEKAGFVRKFGAQFHLTDGVVSQKFEFGKGKFTEYPSSFQVDRARFDHLLMENAREVGAEVWEGCTVQRREHQGDHVQVSAKDSDGNVIELKGRFLIDASGRANLTGNQDGTKRPHPRLKKIAVFGRMRGDVRDVGNAGGDTVILRQNKRWFWLIPVGKEEISVGCVMDQQDWKALGKEADAELCLRRWVKEDALLEQKLGQASWVGTFRTTTDFSYHNETLVGPRLARIGDAAGFLDPVFSAGVYLAMWTGKLAAETMSDALDRGTAGAAGLKRYHRRVYRAMVNYWAMVEQFYTTPFMEIFMQPRDKWDLPSAVNALLAGRIEAPWYIRWRLKLFFFLVRLQSRYPIMERLAFPKHSKLETHGKMGAESNLDDSIQRPVQGMQTDTVK